MVVYRRGGRYRGSRLRRPRVLPWTGKSRDTARLRNNECHGDSAITAISSCPLASLQLGNSFRQVKPWRIYLPLLSKVGGSGRPAASRPAQRRYIFANDGGRT